MLPGLKPKKVPGLLASFEHIDGATDAIAELRRQGYHNLVAYSSHPNHELEEALGHRSSPVRLFTLIGGITGGSAALGMQVWMNRDWPVLVGGKPIVALPAFVVIIFELTVLVGALSTLFAVGFFSVLFGKRGVKYDARFTDDRVGLFVPADAGRVGAVEQLLRRHGAVEVQHA